MRLVFIAAAAAATLAGVAPSLAQPVPPPGYDRDRPGYDRPGVPPRFDRDPRFNHGPRYLSREQSLRLRGDIIALNNQITSAERARRIGVGQADALRGRMRGVEQFYASRQRDGLTRGEYEQVQQGLSEVRGRLMDQIRRGGGGHRWS